MTVSSGSDPLVFSFDQYADIQRYWLPCRDQHFRCKICGTIQSVLIKLKHFDKAPPHKCNNFVARSTPFDKEFDEAWRKLKESDADG